MKTLFVLVLILVAVNQGMQLFQKPKEVIKQVEVIRQVPIEVVRYVEVPKIVEVPVQHVAREISRGAQLREAYLTGYRGFGKTTNLRDHSYESRRRR